MDATVAAAAALDERITKIEGPVGSGKTESLIRRACRLVSEGADPESILLAVSTAEAARVARGRLSRAFEREGLEGAEQLVVSPAQDACLAVLETEGAREFTGRSPRVLTAFEYNFLLEDLKTLGQPVRALRQTVRAMRCHWERLDDEAEWVLPGTEGDVFDLARKLMIAEGGMIAQEVPYLCAAYLSSEAGRASSARFDHVLADDYQNLSLAQQTCLCLLARETLAVAGNGDQAVECAQAAPYPQGFDDFDALRRNVATVRLGERFLDDAVAAFCDALSAETETQRRLAAPDRLTMVKWNTPDDEFNGMTRYLLKVCAGDLGVRGGELCVVAPNRQWALAFEVLLKRRGLAVSSLGFSSVGGDPRDMARAQAMVAYTALNLVAYPDDVVAWRAWCGYGNYIARSEGWAALVVFCEEKGLGLLDGLRETARLRSEGAAEPYLRAWALAERFEEGLRVIRENSPRRGFDLLRAAGASGQRAFSALEETMDGDEDARVLYDRIRAAQFSPVHGDGARKIHLSSYDQMPGTTYRLVFPVGCVDGFVPHRDAFEVVSTEQVRKAVEDAGRRSFVNAVGKGADGVTFSLFSRADLELAERTNMLVSRVRMEDGARVAAVRPSAFFAQARAASPLCEGGQALLSEEALD